MKDKPETKTNDFSDRFISRLEALVRHNDRGALANLRRGQGRDVSFYVYRFVPAERTRWQEKAALMIGPMFAAWHQGTDRPRNAGEKDNLGASMRALVSILAREGGRFEEAMKSVERRFSALINCHTDDLAYRLRHIISLLKSKEVPVNWRMLCDHIQWWHHDNRWVQNAWARSFWAPLASSTDETDETETENADEEIGADFNDM